MKILDLFKKKKQPERKIRIAVFSDLISDTTGVAIQTSHIVSTMLRTGKYQFYCVGAKAGLAEAEVKPIIPEGGNGDLIILPYPTHGDKNVLQRVIEEFNPDIIWLMTDPRFFSWFPEAIKEVGFKGKTCYYHVWDNYPVPTFLKEFYETFDTIVTISKLTDNVVRQVLKDTEYPVDIKYIPHSVPSTSFYPLPEEEILDTRISLFGEEAKDKFIILFNGKNLYRKNLHSILYAYKDFLDRTEAECLFIAKTDTVSQTGVNTIGFANSIGLTIDNFKLIDKDFDIPTLNLLYNVADITINASFAEGFGLPILESLMTGTPVIAPYTGGIPDQMQDEDTVFGVTLFANKRLISVPEVPYIYESIVDTAEISDVLEQVYLSYFPKGDLKELGQKGRGYVTKTFNMDNLMVEWDNVFTTLYRSR